MIGVLVGIGRRRYLCCAAGMVRVQKLVVAAVTFGRMG